MEVTLGNSSGCRSSSLHKRKHLEMALKSAIIEQFDREHSHAKEEETFVKMGRKIS